MSFEPFTYDITIYRGLVWLPRVFIAFDDVPPPPYSNGDGEVVNLTGHTPHAFIKRRNSGERVLDLAPVITNPTGGETTIGKFTDEQTITFPHITNGVWSLAFELPNGDWLGPIVAGAVNIIDNPTEHQ